MKNLSWEFLIFLLDRTDFSEPWMGFGSANNFKDELIKTAKKKVKDDSIKDGVLKQILNRKGYE